MASNQVHVHQGIYSGAEIKEGVLQMIIQLVPEDTPLLVMIGRGTATHVKHEWLTRDRGTRVGTLGTHRGVPPGEPFVEWTQGTTDKWENLAVPSRKFNYCEIFRVLPRVDETTLAVNMHGVTDILADQIEFRAADFAIYIEERLWNGVKDAGPTGAGDTTAWQLGGLTNEISDNSLDIAGASITDLRMQKIFNDIWSDGGRPQDLFCGPRFKSEMIQSLPTSMTKFVDMHSERRDRIINTISVYEGGTQTITVHLTRDLDDNDPTTASGDSSAGVGNHAMLLDRSFLSVDWLQGREPFIERLPRFGGAEFVRIEGQCTLNFGNEKAHGEIIDIAISTGL